MNTENKLNEPLEHVQVEVNGKIYTIRVSDVVQLNKLLESFIEDTTNEIHQLD